MSYRVLVGDLLLVGLALVLGGLASAIAFAVCLTVLVYGGSDSHEKHGISHLPSFRLGGVFIVSYLLVFLGLQWFTVADFDLGDRSITLLSVALAFFCLGLAEDLRGNIHPYFRLVVMFSVAILGVLLIPTLSFGQAGVSLIDRAIGLHALIPFVIAVGILVTLPNAFNIADGANGLSAGVGLCSLLFLVFEIDLTEIVVFAGLIASLSLFIAHNLVHGRFFLGDGGAYFVGALVGLNLVHVSRTDAGLLWPLLCIVFYPMSELIFSAIRRYVSGLSPTSADNNHFHNYLYQLLGGHSRPGVILNNFTGLCIVALFSCAPLALYYATKQTGTVISWPVVYLVMWGIYVLLYFTMKRRAQKRLLVETE